MTTRRIAVTGMGLISPLGNTPAELWAALSSGKSGIKPLTRVAAEALPIDVGGEASTFDGEIESFGPLDKQLQRSIKKGLKLMCREIQMGVAAAQTAIHQSGLAAAGYDGARVGTMFGSDYIISEPGEFAAGVAKCSPGGKFQFNLWGEQGTPQVEPLWLLKYLPNMPASHVAIFNDFRGPSNSVTLREASSNLSVAESVTTMRRHAADAIVVGSTGSRIQTLRTIHVVLQEQCAPRGVPAEQASRPFDAGRKGMVVGEGAGVLVLEDADAAAKRGAKVWGEVVGYASSTVASRNGVANYRQAFTNVIDLALHSAGMTAADLGHVHAHGLSTIHCDSEEAQAIRDRLGDVPVVAAKSQMGNLGAGSGMVEMIASLMALEHNQLFPIANYETPDPACPINAVTQFGQAAGTAFLNLNCSPQGQASAVIIRKAG
jgi:3-oxoacyl-[acyl-carrier-protein] synthase II